MSTVARQVLLAVTAIPVLLSFFATPPAGAQSKPEPTPAELAEQLQALKREYEARIAALEAQLSAMETKAKDMATESASSAPAARPASDNAFNPAIGVVLNGMFSHFSNDEFEIPGFPVGHESEAGRRGALPRPQRDRDVGQHRRQVPGGLTLGLGVHPGEPDEVELEGGVHPDPSRRRRPRRHAHQGGPSPVDVRLPERAARARRRLCGPSAPLPGVPGQRLQRRRRGGLLRPAHGSLQRARRRPLPGRRLPVRRFERRPRGVVGLCPRGRRLRARFGVGGSGDTSWTERSAIVPADTGTRRRRSTIRTRKRPRLAKRENTKTSTDTPSCSPKACSAATRGSTPSTFAPPGRPPETRTTAR